MTDVAFLACWAGGSRRDDEIDLEPDELGSDLVIELRASVRIAVLDRDGATLAPAEFVESLYQ